MSIELSLNTVFELICA